MDIHSLFSFAVSSIHHRHCSSGPSWLRLDPAKVQCKILQTWLLLHTFYVFEPGGSRVFLVAFVHHRRRMSGFVLSLASRRFMSLGVVGWLLTSWDFWRTKISHEDKPAVSVNADVIVGVVTLTFRNHLEKLLLISINFTPKTSHSCLTKMVH